MSDAPSPLPTLLLEPLVRQALEEDLGRAGDITTDAIISSSDSGDARFVARKQGIIAGLDVAQACFRLIDSNVTFDKAVEDGASVAPGDHLATVSGTTRTILMGERTALNFLGRLSGIATATAEMVAAVASHQTAIVCTRKTTPGHRILEKYAVRVGGGINHRFGLDDAMLIKDNHVAAAGGIIPALERARAHAGHLVKIDIEVDTLDQLDEVLSLHPDGADVVMLDNFSPDQVREAAKRIDGRLLTEISGGVTLQNVAELAAAGADLISSGALTHSVGSLDIGLDFD
ncbi:MAG TPA: carboxylating nicotinate-nucleotide diphosphorylase [Rhodospirillaceae bacterium]|nr:carboxylating nicotinate-nucleotide diphosphorylase [Rhodospirillaceae bacterium]